MDAEHPMGTTWLVPGRKDRNGLRGVQDRAGLFHDTARGILLIGESNSVVWRRFSPIELLAKLARRWPT